MNIQLRIRELERNISKLQLDLEKAKIAQANAEWLREYAKSMGFEVAECPDGPESEPRTRLVYVVVESPAPSALMYLDGWLSDSYSDTVQFRWMDRHSPEEALYWAFRDELEEHLNDLEDARVRTAGAECETDGREWERAHLAAS